MAVDTKHMKRTAALLRIGAACGETAADELEAAAREIDNLRMVAVQRGDGGHCTIGEKCRCGGDTPAVRAGCLNWIAHNAALTGAEGVRVEVTVIQQEERNA